MNFRKLSFSFLSASTLLTSCGGTPNFNLLDATITIAPQITSLDVNGTQTFTATVTGASAKNVTWQIRGFSLGGTGSFSPAGTGVATGATVTYNAPATPPVYMTTTGSYTTSQPWSSQGMIGITASVQSADASVVFPIIGPTSVGILPAATSVQLGELVYLFPYCVGWANNGVNWLVNGVANGSTATGTMTVSTQFAYYTAPVAMPVSGNTVIVTAVCQADPTKTASTTVTLTK